jgi:two-component system, NtrC family, nitrogen regulation sensor histidine kinase NtrY
LKNLFTNTFFRGIGGLIGLLGCGLVYFLLPTYQSIQQTELIAPIQTKLKQEIRRLDVDTREIQTKIQNKGWLMFQTAKNPTKYPYLIFLNRKVLYWSDYHFVPEYSELPHNELFSFQKFKVGGFVVARQVVNLPDDTLEIYSLLPIYRKYKVENAYLKSGLNPQIFADNQFEIKNQVQNNGLDVFSTTQAFLFSLSPKAKSLIINDLKFYLLGFFILLTLGSVGWQFKIWTRWQEKHKNYELSLGLWLVFLLGARWVIWVWQRAFGLPKWEIFDPQWFPNYWFTQSVGDLFLHLLVLGFWVYYALRYFPKARAVRLVVRHLEKQKIGWSILLILLSNLLIISYFTILNVIFIHSRLEIDITRNIHFNFFHLISLLIFALLSAYYFLINHLLIRLFLQINAKKKRIGFLIYLLANSLIISILYIYLPILFLPILLNALVFWVLFQLKLPKNLYRFNYLSSIYLFAGAMLCAGVGTYAIYNFGKQKGIEEKRRFANRLLPENDELAENLLGQATELIRKDEQMAMLFDTLQNKSGEIKQKIRKTYLGNYFDKYEVQIIPFGLDDGKPLNTEVETEGNYSYYRDNYQKIFYDTGNEEIWFVDKPGVNLIKRYLVFVQFVNPEENRLGYLIIDLKQKKATPTNVYPELLVDKNYLPAPETKAFSYAIYEDSLLVYSVGIYNYDKNFKNRFFDQDAIFLTGIAHAGFEHLAVQGGFKKRVVVSSPVYDWQAIFSNFAFLFLLLVLVIVIWLVIYSLRQRTQGAQVTFATRIQFYLNIAFFLPLFTVSITTLSILSSNYRQNFNDEFVFKTEGIARNLAPYLANFRDNKISREQLAQNLAQIAQYAELDINIFDESGKLIISSQPAIYENDVLSPYINPEALQIIKGQKNNYATAKESAGELNYQSVYVPIKFSNPDKVQLSGIVSIPFFDSNYELNKQLREVLSTIINIFASIFIVFVILSYFASQILTVPLRLITQKIRKTTFYNYNEPLEWNSKDEIGLFVEEYNKMLKKLDRSKEDLARNQKESAWREIAQQVAHEIKNPLTPMKLTLQMMNVRLENQSEQVRLMFERSLDTLLNQVEILSDIATSFSSFAKMPIPISERFEITAVLRDSQSLYSNEDLDLTVNITPGKFFVRGDQKLIGRIFTNLIKNAIEAIPEDRRPTIEINLTNEIEGLIKIEIKDNGIGVPRDAQDKIFMPNFTTKTSGSGIGLAVSKRGIEHAGGRIWFETEEEVGTSFFIELPLVE